VQKLLQSQPKRDVAVFAVWVDIQAGDARGFWNPTLLSDSRVEHLWDGNRVVAGWYGAREGGGAVYDVYYLYGPKGDLEKTEPVLERRPVVYQVRELASALSRGSSG
jgi:hypothetical protein